MSFPKSAKEIRKANHLELSEIETTAQIKGVTVKDYVSFSFIALTVQFVLLLLLVGAGLLAYSYGVATMSYEKKHMGNGINLDDPEFKSEAVRYAVFYCNALYLILFLVLRWLITFRRIYTKTATVVGLSGFLTSVIASQ